MELNDLNDISHTDISKMKITINNVIYELDKKEYEDNIMAGNTNMVLIGGIIYLANDEDYKLLTQIEDLQKMKQQSDETNGKKLE